MNGIAARQVIATKPYARPGIGLILALPAKGPYARAGSRPASAGYQRGRVSEF